MSEAVREDRRWRIYWLSYQDVLGAFLPRWKLHDAVVLRFLDGVPDDARVLDVHHDWTRHAFGLRLAHPSFEEVPEGAPLPWHGPAYAETVSIDKGPQGACAYDALLEENRRLRMVFSDLCQDDERTRLAYEQGQADLARYVYEP